MEELLKNAFTLFLYLAPGFIAREVYLAKYPARRGSETAILLWSAIYSFAIYVVLAALAVTFSDPRLDLLRHPLDHGLDAPSIAIVLAAGACGGAVLSICRRIREAIPLLPKRKPEKIWPVLLASTVTNQLWAVVRVRDGTSYLGWIKEFTFDPDSADNDFYLSPAFLLDGWLTLRWRPSAAVYLSTRDVRSIEFLPGR